MTLSNVDLPPTSPYARFPRFRPHNGAGRRAGCLLKAVLAERAGQAAPRAQWSLRGQEAPWREGVPGRAGAAHTPGGQRPGEVRSEFTQGKDQLLMMSWASPLTGGIFRSVSPSPRHCL